MFHQLRQKLSKSAMLTNQTLLNDIAEAVELTHSAILSAEQKDWNQAHECIQKREVKLANLPDKFSDFNEEQQTSIRVQLEQLDSLNTQFLAFVNHSRDEVMRLKSNLGKNRDAINQYLDHA